MDTSIDTFYKTMHQQNRLEFHQLEQFIQRVTHDVFISDSDKSFVIRNRLFFFIGCIWIKVHGKKRNSSSRY